MTITASKERLNYTGAEGCDAPGLHRQVISGVGATRTLLASESNALCLFDRAAGNIYTLPAPVVGMTFEFRAIADVTTNAYKVITNAGTVFIVGSIMAGNLTVAASSDVFQANGTSHTFISMDGVTKGGLIGGSITLTCISTTVWSIEGDVVGSGTNADPFG